MKKSRKLMSVLLIVAMLFTLAAPAMAADTTYTITINNSETGHTYEAYQIFAGDLHDGVLSNITWGSGVSAEGQTALGGAAAKAKALKTAEDAAAFAKEVATYLVQDQAKESTFANDVYTISGLEAGYYLVKDKNGSLSSENDDAYTEYLLKVVADVTATPKSSVPEVEKKVKDTNDSEANSTTGWQDSADYDIGDDVSFQLKATLATNVSKYTTYKIVFHDTLSAGLTYNYDAKVMFGETDVTSKFEITHEGGILTISCDNVKVFDATNGSEITVEYTAKLNDNATIGSAGNENKVRLEYSNNPNGEGTGKTEEDIVKVFTYKVIVNKVDENKKPLAGAGFTLYKYDASVAGDDKYVAVGNELKGDTLTTFEWKGLDDGDYKLVETTTPAGYNTIEDILFTITATHTNDPKALTLETLTGGDKFTGEVSTGNLSADVENKSGATLPETGGIGTTVFYVLGGALVLGAVVLLVTRRRMAE